ncbi:HAMP domain-containing methyl-accepting chemotaxis protein [Sporosarcina saromensis]|uniref:HAMP domain-containing methyl-accepting chemotaxis protein n=1 Tax=Sporosarcina saromensis TaxID=359365 RepID=A0ABU4GDX7_9BACL|nr:HAMP domain-containing methyl-accepting chemotaxis protein [Sporosarcina saromensis]MDW0115185.1 HAMP domain-containing methyl-accepting chemotaxis protein [Sporosarcina saromensis]
MKKMGVFQRNLIGTLVISISLLVIAIVSINYITSQGTLEDEKAQTEKLIEENLLSVIEGSDVAYSIIEQSLSEKMELYTNVLLEEYKQNPDVSTWDLKQFKTEFDGFDIFFLNDKFVIDYATREADLGLDLKEFGLEGLLQERMDAGTYFDDRLEISEATKETNKFSYTATPDKKYMIQIAATADQFSHLIQSMDLELLTKNLMEKHPYVEDIGIYTINIEGIPAYSMNKKNDEGEAAVLPDSLLDIGAKAIAENKVMEKKSSNTLYKFIPQIDLTSDDENKYRQSRLLVLTYDDHYFAGQLKKNSVTALIMVVVSVIVAVVLSIVIGRRVSRPIHQFSAVIERTAQLDFTDNEHVATLVKRKDDFGVLAEQYEQMLVSVRGAFEKVIDSTHHLMAMSEQFTSSADETKTASVQISSSVQEMAYETENQTQTVRQSITDIGMITEEVGKLLANISKVNELVQQTVQASTTGNAIVTDTEKSMEHINTYTKQSKETVIELHEKSSQIENFSTFITSIADQTNLLALNAAIESARAGEAGKGFAVVANEVRKLAEESSNAANHIRQLITEIKEDISQTVDSMTEGYETVKNGTSLVHEAGEAFRDILTAVQSVSSQTTEATSISKEVEQVMQNLLQSIQQIASLYEKLGSHSGEIAASTEEQTATVEEVAYAAKNLSDIAEDLQREIEKFKV